MLVGTFGMLAAPAESQSGRAVVYAARAGGRAVAVDTSGSAYVLESAGTYPPSVFVTKLDPDGRRVIYRTLIEHGDGFAIAVDAYSNTYVVGQAPKEDFAATQAFVTPGPGRAAFVVKLDAAGHSSYSVLVGGAEAFANAIAVDAAGNAYVAGASHAADFPTTERAFDRTWNGGGFNDPASDGVVFKLDAAGALVYSTFLGGDDYDASGGIAVDTAGNAYVTGRTFSQNFPTTAGVFQPVNNSSGDAFVTKLNPDGSALVYSTFLGGIDRDQADAIAIDSAWNVYVAGETMSSNFPTTPGAADRSLTGAAMDLFVAKLNATGTALIYGTYLGGRDSEIFGGLAVDGNDNAVVGGQTVVYSYPRQPQGSDDAFVTKLDGLGAVLFSGSLGSADPDGGRGLAIDSIGDVYVTGWFMGTDFPITPDTPTTVPPGAVSAFVAKLVPRATLVAPSATASSQETGWTPPAAAVDGNPWTRWSSQFSSPQWLSIDLGQKSTIDRVIMHWETAYGSAYELQVSDDASTWSTVYSTSSGDGGIDDLKNLTAAGRYVRMLGIQHGTQWGYSIWEFQVFGAHAEGVNIAPTVKIAGPADGAVYTETVGLDIAANASDSDGSVARVDFYVNGSLLFSDSAAPFTVPHTFQPGSYTIAAIAFDNVGASASDSISILIVRQWLPGLNLALGKPVFSSSDETQALPGANAVDNNSATRWSSAFSDPQWIYVDLGNRFAIQTVVLKWETAYASSFQLDVSDDARTWTTIYDTTIGTGGTQTLRSLTGTGRYVRMYGRRRSTPWGYSLWEMEVYGTPADGDATITNLAAGRPTFASTIEDISFAPESATDLSLTTRWSSAFADNQWIYVDLGTLSDLQRVVLRWETAYASHYLLQVSNDAMIWRPLRDVFGGGGVEQFDDLTSTARYVRIYALTRGTVWGVSLWEFEVYGKPAAIGPNLAVGAPAMASSVESQALTAAKATDGDTMTRWSSAFDDGEWITVDLGRPMTLKRLVLRWETAFAKKYTIQASMDGVNWRNALQVDASDGGVDDISVGTWERYIRVFCDERATEWGCSLWELEAYGSPGTAPAESHWKILTLIYATTDFQYTDANSIPRHVIGTISPTQLTEAAAAATRFANEDITALTSGHMVPELTIRYPGTMPSLSPNGAGWWPSPSDTGSARDPAFDAVWVIWQPNVVDQGTGEALWIGSAAGLTPPMGAGQTYMALIVDATTAYGHRNVFKHEFGHSITWYFDAAGTAPKPMVENHTVAGTYVHCGTGEGYVWVDETDANLIPNSIYNNASGFTHDYYSGTTALASTPTVCLGISADAWAAGGPVTRP
jgi:hypothetical protein